MIKRVGSTPIGPVHKSRCHCGAVEMAIRLPDGIVDPRRCNCSICRRNGTYVGSVALADVTIVTGREDLSLYRFGTQAAEHDFCSVCGIYTHHYTHHYTHRRRRSNPHQYEINLGCLDGVDPCLIEGVRTLDGAGDHPSDRRPS